MEPALKAYVAAWSVACIAAIALYLRRPRAFAISRQAYWQFLGEPWKLAAFVAGAALITLVAPYTGDPTWDHVDGYFMTVLCFTTATWVVGTLFLAAKRKATAAEVYVSVARGSSRQAGRTMPICSGATVSTRSRGSRTCSLPR